MLEVVSTGVLGVLWYLWWQWWGKNMARSSAGALTVRQRFASGVGMICWNVSFVLLFISIWSQGWRLLTLPLLILMVFVSFVLNGWAKSKE
jgi:hypothetical protein